MSVSKSFLVLCCFICSLLSSLIDRHSLVMVVQTKLVLSMDSHPKWHRCFQNDLDMVLVVVNVPLCSWQGGDLYIMEFFFLYNVLLLLIFSRRNLNLVVKRFLFFKLFTVSFADVVVAPPFIYIDQVKSSLTDRIEISAQNSWVSKGGAFTGEIRSASCFLFSYSFVWRQLLLPSCKRPIKHNKNQLYPMKTFSKLYAFTY